MAYFKQAMNLQRKTGEKSRSFKSSSNFYVEFPETNLIATIKHCIPRYHQLSTFSLKWLSFIVMAGKQKHKREEGMIIFALVVIFMVRKST